MWFIFMTVFCHFLLAALGREDITEQKEQAFWKKSGHEEIEEALRARKELYEGIAKNVIIFVGDGMGPNTVTASRIYRGGESYRHFFERFPHVGLIKTYSVDTTVPDSACTATAIFSGVKANFETVGVDGGVKLKDCQASLDEKHKLSNIFQWAQEAGKATGFVTNTRVTHATPSSAYAHSADRRWECEAMMPPEAARCKDIARQLVEDRPGMDFKVIMGGGRQGLQSNVADRPNDPVDTWACYSKDGRDLIEDWKKDKKKRNATYAVLENTGDLKKLNWDTEYVLGVFANGHMPYDDLRDRSDKGSPDLEEMVRNAIQVLVRNPNGYVLMVEGGMLDQAHHRGFVHRALKEAVLFDDAVRIAWDYTYEKETLIVVTADHAHSLTINGNTPSRGNILGTTIPSKVDGVPFSILSYMVGGSDNFPYKVENGKVVRSDPRELNVNDYAYFTQAGVQNDEGLHGGVDVAVYAKGPMAHLFHSVHEQSYIAHVIAYAAAIGDFKNRTVNSANSNINLSHFCSLLSLFLFIRLIRN